MNTKTLVMTGMILACVMAKGVAAGVTGEVIFDDKPSRTDKIEKVVVAADAAAERVLQAARIQCLRAQIKARVHALGLLEAEGSLAAREKDLDGMAAVAVEKKRVGSQLSALQAKLKAEDGEGASDAPEPGAATHPADTPAVTIPSAAQAGDGAEVSPPVAGEGGGATPAVPAGEVPKLMLGKWKRVENGKVWGYYILKSTGLVRSYAVLKADGTPSGTTGIWKVWDDGAISFVNDDDGGNDMLRVNLTSEDKAEGRHHLRQSDAQPYKVGTKTVELIREDR